MTNRHGLTIYIKNSFLFKMKKIIITENQKEHLLKLLSEDVQQMPVPPKANKPYTISPEKVLIVKKFLDTTFPKRGSIERIGADGLKETVPIASIVATTGEPLKNFYKEDLCDLLIEKFKKMFIDHVERELFMKQVVDDWFNNKISVHGLLSKNYLQ